MEDKRYGLPDDEYYMLIEDKIAQRKIERIERKRRERRKAGFTFGFVLLFIACIVFSFSDFFAISSIEVEGNAYFTDEEIISIAHAEPGSNLLYRPGKKPIIDYLEANPYIRGVKVRRKLPNTLVIDVDERTQTAALVYDDDYLVIDEEGILLRKTNTEPKVTIVDGIKISRIKLGEPLEVEDQVIMDNALSIIRSMIKNDLYFKRISMTDLYIRAYIYDTLLCKGATDYLVDAMDRGRLHKVVEDLMSKNIRRGTITISEDGYASFIPGVE